MKTGRFWLAAVAGLLGVAAAMAESGMPEEARIQQIEAEISSTRTLLGQATNEMERGQWQTRVALLEQDLQNVRQRIDLAAREKSLAAEQKRHGLGVLREQLHVIETDVTVPQAQARNLDRTIQELRSERGFTEDRRAGLVSEGAEANAERIAEIDQRLRNLDEVIYARKMERDAADLKIRLGNEALRIDGHIGVLPVNPRPTINILLEKRRHLEGEERLAEETAARVSLLEQKRKELATALGLTREKIGHMDAEISILERKRQVADNRNEVRHLLLVAESEKKLLTQRQQAQEQQVAAADEAAATARQLLALYQSETTVLADDLAAAKSRGWRMMSVPVSVIAGLVIVYNLLSFVILPLVYRRDALFIARRLSKYLLSLAIVVVIALFFLEDLKQVATVLGIASAAIVIALQDLFSALAGWFVIVASRKIRVGDRIEVDGHAGDVVDLQLLRTTLLEINNWLGVDEPTGRVIILPNNFVFKTKVFNYTHVHPYVWNKIDITVTYETPAEEAGRLLKRILVEETQAEFVEAERAAWQMEKAYGVPDTVYQPKFYSYVAESGVTFRLVFVSHYRNVGGVRNRLNSRIIAEFGKDPRMQFAYPTQRHIPTPENGILKVVLDKGPAGGKS